MREEQGQSNIPARRCLVLACHSRTSAIARRRPPAVRTPGRHAVHSTLGDHRLQRAHSTAPSTPQGRIVGGRRCHILAQPGRRRGSRLGAPRVPPLRRPRGLCDGRWADERAAGPAWRGRDVSPPVYPVRQPPASSPLSARPGISPRGATAAPRQVRPARRPGVRTDGYVAGPSGSAWPRAS